MATVLWKRIDQPGHETARLTALEAGHGLEGAAVFGHDGQACRLDYRIGCDAAFRTRSVSVVGWIGERAIDLAIDVDGGGRWRANGAEAADVAGCLDVDLAFSPATNLLPIRRLGLAIGESAAVRAAWLRFPELRLEPLDQVYRRTSPATYRYESDGGKFVADLVVNAHGFVLEYPHLWSAANEGPL